MGSKYTLIFVGPMGHGKSSSANKISGKNLFTVGKKTNSVTQTVVKKTVGYEWFSDLTLCDCPGFGDQTQPKLFLHQFISQKKVLLELAPISAFVMVIKFDQDQCGPFLVAARAFVKCFGSQAIKSLFILCIQVNPATEYSDSEFENIFYQSDGARHLAEKNDGQHVRFCLWDNKNDSKYPSQAKTFHSLLVKTPEFTKLQMQYAFDMIGNQLE